MNSIPIYSSSPIIEEALAPVLAVAAVLDLHDDGRLQDFDGVPGACRDDTTEYAGRRIHAHPLQLIAAVVIGHLDDLPAEQHHTLVAVRMAMSASDAIRSREDEVLN